MSDKTSKPKVIDEVIEDIIDEIIDTLRKILNNPAEKVEIRLEAAKLILQYLT